MSDPRLEAKSLGHWYQPNAWLFRNVDLTVTAGSTLAILGPNGRGKSTLLRILAGLARQREGYVQIAGRTAFVPADANATFDYTTHDIVLMGRARRIGLFAQPSRNDKIATEAVLDRLKISHLASRTFTTLSSGERQMALLARALASEADILFMDEPTAALDLRHQLWLAAWMRRLVRDDGLSLVFTTHDPNQAREIASEVLLMHPAPDHEAGLKENLLTTAHLSRLFDCKVVGAEYDHDGLRQPIFVVPPRSL